MASQKRRSQGKDPNQSLTGLLRNDLAGIPTRFPGGITASITHAHDSRAHKAARFLTAGAVMASVKLSPFLLLKLPLEATHAQVRKALMRVLAYFRNTVPAGNPADHRTVAELRRAARAPHGSRSGGRRAHRQRDAWLKKEHDALRREGVPEQTRWTILKDRLRKLGTTDPEHFGNWKADKQDLYNLTAETIKKIVYQPPARKIQVQPI